MKYAVWFVRLVFAGWMIPAGLNHFVPLFAQPLGNQPLSRELFTALFDSHLFDLVKAVELIAGIGVLTGFYLPLALVVCLPVSFTVWYWDTELQGWWTVSAIYGWAVLLCNLFLVAAYFENYRAMFNIPRREPAPRGRGGHGVSARLLPLRLAFGALLVVNAINHFAGPFVTEPAGSAPLAWQLMIAVRASHLLDVVIAIHGLAGLAILSGIAVPFALCVALPISVCAAFWAAILEHHVAMAAIALVMVAVNAALMFAHLDAYRGVLQRRALAAGEGPETSDHYEGVFMNPMEGIPPVPFAAALVVLVAAFAFYWFLVPSATGTYAMLAMAVPGVLLLVAGARGLGHRGAKSREPA